MSESRIFDADGYTADFDDEWDSVTISTGIGRVFLPVAMLRDIIAAADEAKPTPPILTAVNA